MIPILEILTKVKKLTLFFLFLNLFFFPRWTSAVSIISITGTLNHGQSITVNGSGFGIKSPAAPVKWDNFNGGVEGEHLNESYWTLTVYSGGTEPVYSDDYLRTSVSNMSVKLDMTSGNSSFGYDGDAKRYWYVNYWRYDIAGLQPRNFKHYRIYPIGPEDALPQAACTEATSGEYGDYLSVGLWPEDGNQFEDFDNVYTAHLRNQWVREEFYIDVGVRGGSPNGKTSWWQNAILKSSLDPFSHPGLPAGYTRELGCPRIGHYWSANGASPDLTAYFSECYIDNTQARIEIGDANTWNGCTHREIQIPSAWATGEITATVNRGSFGAAEEVFLYVVDSDGIRNENGKPVQFGQTYGSPYVENLLSTGVFFYRSPIFYSEKKLFLQPASRPHRSPIKRPGTPSIISAWA